MMGLKQGVAIRSRTAGILKVLVVAAHVGLPENCSELM